MEINKFRVENEFRKLQIFICNEIESLDNKGTFQAESKFGILTYTAFHSQPLFQSQSTRRNTNDNPLDTVITLKVFSFEPISETFAPTT